MAAFPADLALTLLQVNFTAHPAAPLGALTPNTSPPLGEAPALAKHKYASSSVMMLGVDTGFEGSELFEELSMPLAALALGSVLFVKKTHQLTATLFVCFGAQAFMNLCMKIVLSRCVVSHQHGLIGVPAPFFVTAFQQVVSLVFMMWLAVTSAYKPKPIQSRQEWISILCLSVGFTLNIVLNHFSMALLDLSVNLMIRSCSPLTTYLCQVAVTKAMGTTLKAKHIQSTVLLLIGVFCGVSVVYAKSVSLPHTDGERSRTYLGITACLCSLLASAAEMNVIGVMGTKARMNALDAVCCMAIPATLMLLAPAFLWSHPVSWQGHGSMTDFAVFQMVCAINPRIFGLVFLSGFFALFYNLVMYSIIQAFSPAHASVASNLNKMALIAIAYVLGMKISPRSPWDFVLEFGVIGNGLAFAGFGCVESAQREKDAAAVAKKKSNVDEDSTEIAIDKDNVNTACGTCTVPASPLDTANLSLLLALDSRVFASWPQQCDSWTRV